MPRTEPARGMRDFLPEDVRRRAYVIAVIARVFERYGFEPLETPAVENLETLQGKYGEEGNRLIFKILKRGEHEATGQADLALRYDLTVPLARVVAEHQGRLPRFFKRYQIQPVWRADRPARGRFREFYQCDVDVLGSTSPVVEAELCAAASDALKELGFADFVIRLNHRQLLTAILDGAGVPERLHGEALVALDKLDKIGAAGVAKELADRGVEDEARSTLLSFFGDPASRSLDWVAAFVGERGADAVANLRAILSLADATSAAGRVQLDLTLARGLSYYTGAIMEINVPDLAGSLGGGGRYDNLIGMFSAQAVPACGFSLGLERILVVMAEREMFGADAQVPPADVLMATFDAKSLQDALRVAGLLRRADVRVEMYPEPDKIGKQIKYATSRGIPFVALLGEDEIAAGTVAIKDLVRQKQDTYPQDKVGKVVRELLEQRRG
jgi:histidyl-tRNA synthetase